MIPAEGMFPVASDTNATEPPSSEKGKPVAILHHRCQDTTGVRAENGPSQARPAGDDPSVAHPRSEESESQNADEDDDHQQSNADADVAHDQPGGRLASAVFTGLSDLAA